VAAGVLMGLAAGLAISLVLVFVVNPQSFHWTMDLVLPAGPLAALAAAVLAAGVATAAFTARRAAGRRGAVGEGGLVNPAREKALAGRPAGRGGRPPCAPCPLRLAATAARGGSRLLTPQATDMRRGRRLQFPRDHGAHLGARTEWWYLTGWLGSETRPVAGFQVTFFRSRTGWPPTRPAALPRATCCSRTPPSPTWAAGATEHDQRIVRWNGDPDAPLAAAATDDGACTSAPGAGVRAGRRALASRIPARDFDRWTSCAGPHAAAAAAGRRRLLAQGARGSPGQPLRTAEPQLAATAAASRGRALRRAGSGRAWLDHEWSDALLHPEAVGWDWIGMNLFDGSALTAFQLRRADGSAAVGRRQLPRRAGRRAPRAPSPETRCASSPRRWRSPATGAVPGGLAGGHAGRRLRGARAADAQELDSRASTGTVYWEGLSELLTPAAAAWAWATWR
jgi:hypothetical protein